MDKFITNSSPDKNVSRYAKEFSKDSGRLDFLVGYFFFSGFCEICDAIKDTPLRVLVGMDAGIDSNNCIVEYTRHETDDSSKERARDKYFSSLKKIIGKANELDTEEIEKSFRVFIEKLENGSLEVRKTRFPNHAKMYLFSVDKGARALFPEPKAIVGSSNFSIQGFRNRNEVNVLLQDSNDYDDGMKIFEELWKDSIPLVSKENKDEFMAKVLKKTWLECFPPPYLLYVRVLLEYFKVSNGFIKTPFELTRGSKFEYSDISYQIDAIKDGVEKLKKHSGLIVADVVGLGKSIVASCIAANIDRRVVVVCPPHLQAQWEDYAMSFRFCGCQVCSSGKLEDAVKKNTGGEPLTVIVDEAHRYKNENTEAYALLHELCAGNYAILLSATPFNNRPSDIFSLIKLFEIPTNSTIQTVDNLGEKMAELTAEYDSLKSRRRKNKSADAEFEMQSKKIAGEIRSILDPVLIRRTRVDLEKIEKYRTDLQKRGMSFSIVRPPENQHYKLGELSALYAETLEKLSGGEGGAEGFIGARYKPLTYLRQKNGKVEPALIKKYSKHFNIDNFAAGQRNMASFMKQLLVRRFESSKPAFQKTLGSIFDSMALTKKYFEEYKMIPMDKKRRYPDADALESALGDDPDEILDEINKIFDEKEILKIDAADISEKFMEDLGKDIALVESLIDKWNKTTSDPKLSAIVKTIKKSTESDKKRKIIIFSEFADTVDVLFGAFKKEGIRCLKYTSKDARASLQKQVRDNFDAGLQGKDGKFPADDFDVLIATDAISEGFSLHRAGTIYNYDIPYNPTRVIQRVGRINRINKKVFDELCIYNFFPTDTGEEVSHTKEISTFKMKLFQAILGSDTKILTEDEVVAGYMDGKVPDEDSWDAEFRNELYQIERDDKETIEKARALPDRCKIGRGASASGGAARESGLAMFSKKGDSCRFCFVGADGEAVPLEAKDALNVFRAAKDEKPMKRTAAFYSLYEKARKEGAFRAKNSAKISDGAAKALDELRFLRRQIKDDEYLDTLAKVLDADSLPEYVVKKISGICRENASDSSVALSRLKEEVAENYIETLFEKNRAVGGEPLEIVVAEEFSGK